MKLRREKDIIIDVGTDGETVSSYKRQYGRSVSYAAAICVKIQELKKIEK